MNQSDVLIVGAGLSGIGAAFHLTRKCPGMNYKIIEARDVLGGTWDLFRYPGIRSDSDMYTLGYTFRPWRERKAIADGPDILQYIQDTAQENGIDRHIHYQHRLLSAHWSSSEQRWSVQIEIHSKEVQQWSCRFLFMCTGYYDYAQGHQPPFPGMDDFRGMLIHPQHWRRDCDYTGKRVLVIGSGATAVTLVPELAKKAAHVTMLQRSPTYVLSIPAVDSVAEACKSVLPEQCAHQLIRWKNILLSMGFYQYCRRFPVSARRFILDQVKSRLPQKPEVMPDFTPHYQPWDQRLCFVPDSDLFAAINNNKASIVTAAIDRMTTKGVRLSDGRELEADIIVSATGLKIKFCGGVKLTIDGDTVDYSRLVPFKGCMFSGIPNFAMAFGYINASWTLKCDLIAEWVARLLASMQQRHYQVVMPQKDPNIELAPLLEMNSGYIQRAQSELPRQGRHSPWKTHQNYFMDLMEFRLRPLHDQALEFR